MRGAVPQHQLLFELAGRMKRECSVRDAKSEAKARALLTVARYFVDQCIENGIIDPSIPPHIHWEDDEQLEIAFLVAWRKRKHAEGGTLVGEAIKLAEEEPVEFVGLQNRWLATRLANIARRLQQEQGANPISMPIRKFERLLGVPHASIAYCIENLVKAGILCLVDPSYIPGKRARLLRYVGEHLVVTEEPDERVETGMSVT